MAFGAFTITRSSGAFWNPKPKAEIFNSSLENVQWEILIDRYYCINSISILQEYGKMFTFHFGIITII